MNDATLTWLILGSVVLIFLGVIVRMILAARFPKGYRNWAASRRDSFAARNEAWDAADEQEHKR